MSLNLFPVRVPIGQAVDSNGKKIDVLMTPEFARALSDLLARVGGEYGSDSSDIEILAFEASVPQATLPAPDHPSMPVDELAILSQQMKSLMMKFQAMQAIIDTEEARPKRSSAQDAELLSYAAFGSAVSVNWARPGKIGSQVPNSAVFTTLTARGAVALSPASANVVLSPTGTGVVTIAPATAGSMNNMVIGAATALAATFTAVTASALSLFANGIRLNGVNSSSTATGNFVRWSTNIVMQTEATNLLLITKIFNGAVFVDSMTVSSTDVSMPGSLTPAGKFGCNGKTAQAAAASGGAMSTTAATNAAPYGFTTAAQADSIAVKLNAIQAALIANGIMS